MKLLKIYVQILRILKIAVLKQHVALSTKHENENQIYSKSRVGIAVSILRLRALTSMEQYRLLSRQAIEFTTADRHLAMKRVT